LLLIWSAVAAQRSHRFCMPRSEAPALPKRRLRPPHSKLIRTPIPETCSDRTVRRFRIVRPGNAESQLPRRGSQRVAGGGAAFRDATGSKIILVSATAGAADIAKRNCIAPALCRPAGAENEPPSRSGGGARSSLATGYPLAAPAGAKAMRCNGFAPRASPRLKTRKENVMNELEGCTSCDCGDCGCGPGCGC
jgi:hypothetical protein